MVKVPSPMRAPSSPFAGLDPAIVEIATYETLKAKAQAEPKPEPKDPARG